MVGGGAVCGRLAGMRGESVVGQTVQPVQAWKNGRFKLYDWLIDWMIIIKKKNLN